MKDPTYTMMGARYYRARHCTRRDCAARTTRSKIRFGPRPGQETHQCCVIRRRGSCTHGADFSVRSGLIQPEFALYSAGTLISSVLSALCWETSRPFLRLLPLHPPHAFLLCLRAASPTRQRRKEGRRDREKTKGLTSLTVSNHGPPIL
jgi:hypothetical protein